MARRQKQFCRGLAILGGKGGSFWRVCFRIWRVSSAFIRGNTLGTSGYHFGVDFPDTLKDFGQADQYQQTQIVRRAVRRGIRPYCDTVLK